MEQDRMDKDLELAGGVGRVCRGSRRFDNHGPVGGCLVVNDGLRSYELGPIDSEVMIA